MSSAVLQTNLPFPVRRGKVRDVYDLDDKLLIVATDRISAFDVIMPNGIPDKGRILTALSMFWFQKFTEQFENHLVRPDIREFSQAVRSLDPQIAARSMLVRKTKVIPIECVARGYLAGSGWKEYQQTQTVCGVALPAGLRQSDKLPQPIFTPATKEEAGHDINISFERAAEIVGKGVAETVRDRRAQPLSNSADTVEEGEHRGRMHGEWRQRHWGELLHRASAEWDLPGPGESAGRRPRPPAKGPVTCTTNA